ncbi:lipoprotein [Clostridium carnis]
MRKRKIAIIMVLMISIILSLVGCGKIDDIKKKFGMKNDYFEFLNSGRVDKISIQSVRDPSFKFIVTDEKAIANMYTLLSNAKVSETKSELKADYIFEIKVGDEVKKFNYVVGADTGNFYDDENIFTASKRLDEGLIQNLSVIRKPRDFEYVYYNSILHALNLKKEELNNGVHKVGIDIQGDIECLKYVFSIDLEDFLKKAKKITPDVSMVDNNANEFDVIITIKNRGYDSTTYKTNISINNKVDKTQYYYYVLGKNEFKEWNIQLYEEGNVPKEIEKEWW